MGNRCLFKVPSLKSFFLSSLHTGLLASEWKRLNSTSWEEKQNNGKKSKAFQTCKTCSENKAAWYQTEHGQNISYHQDCEKAMCFVCVVQQSVVLAPSHISRKSKLLLYISEFRREAWNLLVVRNCSDCFSLLPCSLSYWKNPSINILLGKTKVQFNMQFQTNVVVFFKKNSFTEFATTPPCILSAWCANL